MSLVLSQSPQSETELLHMKGTVLPESWQFQYVDFSYNAVCEQPKKV